LLDLAQILEGRSAERRKAPDVSNGSARETAEG